MPKVLGTPTVRFELCVKQGHEAKKCPIRAVMSANRVPYRINIGDGCKPSEWGDNAANPKATKDPVRRSELEALNRTLLWWATTMQDIWESYHKKELGKPAPDQIAPGKFRSLVLERAGFTEREEEKPPTMLEFIAGFVKKKELEKGKKHGTVGSLRLAYHAICAYCYQNGALTFDDITPKMIASFYEFLYRPVTVKKLKLPDGRVIRYEKSALQIPSANQIVIAIKQFVNEARFEQLTTNRNVRDIRTHKKPKKTRYAFEVDDLIRIYETDFTGHPREQDLRHVRLLTILGSLTGMRSSDWGKVDKDMVVNDMLEVLTQKTGKAVAIPFFPVLRRLLDEVGWEVPKMNISRYNVYVKEMCRVADIGGYVIAQTSFGGKRDVSTAIKTEKWQAVSSHYCRRFFIRLMLALNTPVVRIMGITGHDTETMLFHYAGIQNGMDARSVSPGQMQKTIDFLNNGSEKVRPMVNVTEKPKPAPKLEKAPRTERPKKIVSDAERRSRKRGKRQNVYFASRHEHLFAFGYNVWKFGNRLSTTDLKAAKDKLAELLNGKAHFARIFTGYDIDPEKKVMRYSVFYKPRKNVAQMPDNA